MLVFYILFSIYSNLAKDVTEQVTLGFNFFHSFLLNHIKLIFGNGFRQLDPKNYKIYRTAIQKKHSPVEGQADFLTVKCLCPHRALIASSD